MASIEMSVACCLPPGFQARRGLLAFLTPTIRKTFRMSHITEAGKAPLPERQPLDVTLRHETVQVGRWDTVSWKLDGVRLGGDGPMSGTTEVDGDRIVHHGIQLRLYRDQVDEYHYNLQSETPRLFVICTVDPTDGSLDPRLATLSHVEAADYMETEEEVLSCPVEGDVRDWIEAWTLLAPVPAPERKKKRRHRSAPSE